MKTRSAINAISAMRWPTSREGKMFPERTFYTAHFKKINETCSWCQQSFMPKAGYYFGPMFVSYAINAAFFIVVLLAMYLLMENITVGSMIGDSLMPK